MKFKYATGTIVKDKVSGIQGTIDIQASLNGSMNQYSIQPKGDGSTVPEGFFVDESTLEVVNNQYSNDDHEIDFKFGPFDRVECQITGIKGVIKRQMHYLNGCIYYNISFYNAKKGNMDTINCVEKMLKLVKAHKEEKTEKKKPGGPTEKSIRL